MTCTCSDCVIPATPKKLTGKVWLQRVPLSRDGYDARCRYWGVGEPLWIAYGDDYGIEVYLRAATRDEAKRAPQLAACTFYR